MIQLIAGGVQPVFNSQRQTSNSATQLGKLNGLNLLGVQPLIFPN
jgi:hypothetical protein